MKLCIASFEASIPLENSYVSLISISDVHFFSKIVRSLYAGCNGMEPEIPCFLIDENERQNELAPSCEIILDPLLIDFSAKSFSTGLVNRFREELNNNVEYCMEIIQRLNEVQDSIVKQLDDFDLPLKYDAFWDASRIVKGLSISIEDDNEGLSQLEILLRFIRVSGDLKIAKYHIFVGLNRYLTKEELNVFYKEALQHQVNVICIEQLSVSPTENEYVYSLHIDDDYNEETIYPKQPKPQLI